MRQRSAMRARPTNHELQSLRVARIVADILYRAYVSMQDAHGAVRHTFQACSVAIPVKLRVHAVNRAMKAAGAAQTHKTASTMPISIAPNV